MANCPVIYAEFAQFLHNLHIIYAKIPRKLLIMIIDVMSSCSLFCRYSFNFEGKTRLRGVIITIFHDTSHIKIPCAIICINYHN